MKSIVSFIAGCFLTSLVATAQDTNPIPAKEKKAEAPKAHVTVIALGPIAKKRYHIPKTRKKNEGGEVEEGAEAILEEGLPELLPPKEGESPPAALYFKTRKNAKDYDRIRIGFNNPASINKLKPNKQHRLYRRNEESGADYKDYLTIPALAEHSQTLLFLTQESKRSNRWLNKPVLNAINLNTKALKKARLHMKNLSSERVYLRIGNSEPTVLMPGASYIYKGENNQSMLRVIAGKGRGGNIPLIRTGIRVPAGNLTTFAFYNADPATNSGKTVGVCRVVTTRLKLPQPEQK